MTTPSGDSSGSASGTISRVGVEDGAIIIDVPALGGRCWCERRSVDASVAEPRVGQPVQVSWERPGPPGFVARAVTVSLRNDLMGTPGA